MKRDLLKNLTVLDFTYRLPGPFATKVLVDLGAKVIKCESPEPFNDPFESEDIYQIAPNFKSWYKNLNHSKEIQKMDLIKDKEKVQSLIENCDVVIYPESNHFKNFLKDFNLSETVVLKIAAGQGDLKSLHDLNVLALTKNFAAHYEDSKHPPYLPFAGIAYGQYISTYILGAIFAKNYDVQTLYMSEIVPELFDLMNYNEFDPSVRTLHNGAYPCYAIFKSSDHKIISLAAIEEKFWLKFVECFKLPLDLADRFDTSGRVYKIIEKRFSKLTSNEIQEAINNQDICLTMS